MRNKLFNSYKSYFPRYYTESKNNWIGSVVYPYIDFEERSNNIKKLRESIAKRELKNFNLVELHKLWKEYKSIETKKNNLDQLKNEIADKIKQLFKDNRNSIEVDKLKTKGKVLRQNIKDVAKKCSEIEEILIPMILMLPNDVDILKQFEDVRTFFSPKTTKLNHLDILKELNLLEYNSPICYFLKNEAAYFEKNILSYFREQFLKKNFTLMSSPDFSRQIVVDACGPNPTPLLLETEIGLPPHYLHGTAHLLPFCSYFAKQISQEIPVKCVTEGRQYEVPHNNLHGLYNVYQKSCVHFFIGTDQENIFQELDNVVNILIDLYKNIKVPFRVCRVSAKYLSLSESFRLSFQCHSSYFDDYVEVGNVSVYNDYISKRLRMYNSKNSEKHFMWILSGTALKVPVLLASYSEYFHPCLSDVKLDKIISSSF